MLLVCVHVYTPAAPQVKSMFASTRAVATCVYLAMLVLTLIVAFAEGLKGRAPLLVLCILVQFVAMCWYVLSYIPFARQVVCSAVKGCCGCSDDAAFA
jgi:hypothetical protein